MSIPGLILQGVGPGNSIQGMLLLGLAPDVAKKTGRSIVSWVYMPSSVKTDLYQNKFTTQVYVPGAEQQDVN